MDARLSRIASGAGINPLLQLSVRNVVQAVIDADTALAAGLEDLLQGRLRGVPLQPLELLLRGVVL
eukprot:11351070-Prorocentrum_lima.AAC.1